MQNQSSSLLLWKRAKPMLVVVAAVAVALALLVWASQPSSSGNTGVTAGSTETEGGTLTVQETYFDFGSISMAAGSVSKEFKVENKSDKPVVIGKLYTSCMCTNAEYIKGNDRQGPFGMPGHGFVPRLNQTLGPGEEATIRVVFDPAAHGPAGLGPIDRVVFLEPTTGAPLELKFKAVVTP